MERFKTYLLNEEKSHLGHRVGDVLTAVQELQNDLGGMGVRQTSRICQEIVDQLRKILHGSWTAKQMPQLKQIQKIAVALMKAIDEKNDLRELIPSISQELGAISGKLGVRTNDIESMPSQDVSQDQMQLTGQGPSTQPQGQTPPPDPMAPQDPSMGGGMPMPGNAMTPPMPAGPQQPNQMMGAI
jgi:hypothetical protein